MAARLALKMAVTIESLQQPRSGTTKACTRGWQRPHHTCGDLKMRGVGNEYQYIVKV
jgi:hypothetical protein